ncbi:Uncharacterised protein [Alloiococcus otitis]|uniref:Uncharacterized protein n=2 Tax=Alloiococcus TaxID=1651 RepID=K9EV10_9LACT|nr:hypothetical protein HMPREF9698_01241 [Alloiococcus otitis ATCC 51267]SUU80797.1 Uncharacterised protein [Alloiococcus otitis]
MGPRFQSKLIEFYQVNKYLLLANFLVYCFFFGNNFSQGKANGFHNIEFALLTMTDHYYLLNAVFPLMLIMLTRYFKQEREEEVIRFVYRRAQVRNEVSIFACWLILYFGTQLILTLVLSTIFFPFSPNFEASLSGLNLDFALFFESIMSVFSNPVFALLASFVYLIFGWLVLVSILSLVNSHFGYRKLVMVTVAFLIVTYLGFNTELDNSFPFLFFNQYFILHHALQAFAQSIDTFIPLPLIGLASLVYVFRPIKRLKQEEQTAESLLRELILPKSVMKWAFVLLGLLLVIDSLQVLYGIVNTGQASLQDVIVRLTNGSHANMPDTLAWMRLLLIIMAPLFIIGSQRTLLDRYGEAHFIIRYSSKALLKAKTILTYSRFLLAYALYLVVALSLLFIAGYGSGSPSVFQELLAFYQVPASPIQVFILLLVLLLAQLFFAFLIYILLSDLLNEVVALLIMVVVSALTAFVSPINMILITSGLSSLVQLLAVPPRFFYLNLALICLAIGIFI